MRALLAIAFALVVECSYSQSIAREYETIVDTGMWEDPVPVEFFRGDSLLIEVQMFRGSSPVLIPSSNVFVLWQLMRPQSQSFVSHVFSGEVLSATNGLIGVSLNAAETDIEEGEYNGYLTMSIGQGFLSEEIRVAQHHAVNVRYGLP